MSALRTNSVIGILGAGQLGKMLAESAKRLGYKTHVYAPDSDPIAASVSDFFTAADYTDISALQTFADNVDVITLEFENVPVEPLKVLSKEVCPSADVLEICQHRIKEKSLAQSLGIATAPFAAVGTESDLSKAIRTVGFPGILKTCMLGYDGKGQWKIQQEADLVPLQGQLTSYPYIYEGFVQFEKEISVIVARNEAGKMQCFEPVENVHKNHILHTTTAPADISLEVALRAKQVASMLADALHVIGLLAVELFVTKGGDVLMNEMAPRPHNSGHWTLDGSNVSQFEQAIRAVTGMPLIDPMRSAKKVVMTNLIGDDVNHLDDWKNKGAHVHTYGKKEVRAGRKMGHVTEVTS